MSEQLPPRIVDRASAGLADIDCCDTDTIRDLLGLDDD